MPRSLLPAALLIALLLGPQDARAQSTSADSKERELLAAIAAGENADGIPTAEQLEPRQELARWYIEHRRHPDALAQLRIAAELGPLETEMAFWLSDQEYSAGRIPAANHQLRSVLESFDSSEAEMRLAVIARNQGQIKPALLHARRAVEFADADESSTRQQLGRVLEEHVNAAFEAGQLAEAMESVQRLMELYPRAPQHPRQLARILTAQGKGQEAIEVLRRAMELDAEVGHGLTRRLARDLGIALAAENRFEEARPFLQQSLDVSGGDLRTQAAMAAVEERLGESESALARAQRVLDSNTTEVEPQAGAYLVIGRVHAGAGRFVEARAALEKAVQLDPRSAKAHYQLSQACARLGDGECAERHLALYRKAQEGPEGEVVLMQPAPVTLRFEDVTRAAGIEFLGPASPAKEYILESVSGGVAIFDADGDGLLDIYLVDSLTVATAEKRELSRSALYRNRGDGTFEDLAAGAGVDDIGWGVGVCVADVDGDGRPDLYVTGVGGNHLFRNVSAGEAGGLRFDDITAKSGTAGDGWSTGCTFADIDLDGDADLFVARYLDLDPYNEQPSLPAFGEGTLCEYRGVAVQCGPRGLPGKSDFFFRNDGTGLFEEASSEVGLADEAGLFGLGAVFFDADGDGRPDLYVANDTRPNYLYLNRVAASGGVRFEDQSFLLGAAVSDDGKEQGSMGIAVGDYRNDGVHSLFVSNFCEEHNAFLDNQGGQYFVDASFRTRTAAMSLPYVGWGSAFLDVDNDRRLDLVVVNGHVYPQIDQVHIEASAPYHQRSMVFRNLGDGTFEDQSRPDAADNPLAREMVSRGLAIGDLDGDGRLDLVVTDLDQEARLLRGVTEPAGHWLIVRLVGRPPRTDSLGALVTVRAGGDTMSRQVLSGGSYLSQHDLRQHFGLGEAVRVESIEVRWSGGGISRFGPVDADQIVSIHQPPAQEGSQ